MNLWRVPIDEASGKVLGDAGADHGALGMERPAEPLAATAGGILYATNESAANLRAGSPSTPRPSPRAGSQPVTQGSRGSPLLRRLAGRAVGGVLRLSPPGGPVRRAARTAAACASSPTTASGTGTPAGRRTARGSSSSRTAAAGYEIWSIRADGSGLEPVTRTTGELSELSDLVAGRPAGRLQHAGIGGPC